MRPGCRLRFNANPQLLEAVRALVSRYCARLGLSPERIQEVTLAVDEACANAIRHGYNYAPEGEITLSLHDDATLFEAVVADKGVHKPAAVKKAGGNKKTASAALLPGGLGLPLIHRVFDDVRITTGPKRGTRVRMRLYLK